MGSSAGAGSEVFHVYRHLRRRENDRQDFIAVKANEEELEEEFQETMAMHRAEDDARTAKKRAKR
ncbi:PRKR-interacting protein 1 homolog [Geodia barretti]|uniref:PRKR-interacting protein 1 homolog n=1 Tax=Geodia barretti TaxID=519541 RepID=A0AA35S5E8_GEOBA|nr:PRKR-interacting protein 1 homolog [Geodia barretti]